MLWTTPKTGNRVKESLKVSSRVKDHHFSKFAIFKWLHRAHQELSFKNKFQEKKCFFRADFWSAKVFSMLIILIDPRQVLSYLIRIPLLNQANHAIWQKSLPISIVLTVFSWILEVNASKEKKRACPFSSSNYEFEVGYTHEKSNCPMSNTFMPLLALPTMSLPSVQTMTTEDEVGMEVDWIENFQPV